MILHDRPVFLWALSGDTRCVGCPVRCVGTGTPRLSALSGDTSCVGCPVRCVGIGEVADHSGVFPRRGHHPLTLSPF